MPLASPGAVSQQQAHILSFHLLIKGSSLGLMKEKPANAVWSIESMSILSPCDSRGFSFRNSLSKLLQSLGDFWEGKAGNYAVTVITNSTVVSKIDRVIRNIHEEEKPLARTTLGLNGGSTSLFSSADQLIALKNGCARMSPTTPNLRLGSRSNSLKKEEDILRLPMLKALTAHVPNHACQGS